MGMSISTRFFLQKTGGLNCAFLATALLLSASISSPGAVTFTTLYSFPKGPVKPSTPLVRGADGNFYGTTARGGTSDKGTVYRVSPTGEGATLYSFSGGTDGLTPGTALIQGSDGNFYGTTKFGGQLGGPNDPQGTGLGTIFRITPAGVLTTLYKFVGGNADGSRPQGDLLQGFDDNFYGTTAAGGTDDRGTVFKMTPAGAVTILYSFTLAEFSNGYNPTAALVKGGDGNYYGTATSGGANFRGVVFKMTPAGVVSPFYSFDDAKPDDGAFPDGPLIRGSDGNFYGTTPKGGTNNHGTVFQITSAGAYTTLYSFSAGGNPDGGGPEGALIEGAPGEFYGTASFGGASGGGIVFKITTAKVFTPLHSFTADGVDGQIPLGALIAGGDGNFYGTSSQGALGGAVAAFRGNGTLFRISPTGNFQTIYRFAPSPFGASPLGALIEKPDGTFYGTCLGGTSDVGEIFKITSAGDFTRLYNFTGDADGNTPKAGLAEGSDGNFYGTTTAGGANDDGTLFKVAPSGAFTLAHTFALDPDGAGPQTSLVLGSDSSLYGVTTRGGAGGENGGVAFKLTSAGATVPLHSFIPADGTFLAGALVQDPDGNFYGTAESDGVSALGTVFRMSPSGSVTRLHSFVGNPDGASPNAALTKGRDGAYYGTTFFGGDQDHGTIFKITTAGDLTILYRFTGGDDGSFPQAPLAAAGDGNFYGTTSSGGSSSRGTIFMVTPAGALTTLYAFPQPGDGDKPMAGLVQGQDGSFYGTTSVGGQNGFGTIFKLAIPGVPPPLQPKLLNIATRLKVLTGEQVLIGGFIITGTDPKKVIIRGIGPSLAQFFSGALADPTLDLYQGTTLLTSNNNWKTDQQAEIEATGIPPSNDLESAIVRTLAPGNYTAILRGNNSATGIGVVEVYDLNQAANSELANISSRGFVDAGDNVMIGGFIAGGGTGGRNVRVIVRAIGPSLAGAGISGALADPTLELHDGSGTTIATNDNWKIRSDGSSQQAEIEATTIPPTNDLESAILSTLAPGNYTAIVRGTLNSTGIAVVEVYNLQ
jgi:uncharacterized repeat protein (TIGR03803 family)